MKPEEFKAGDRLISVNGHGSTLTRTRDENGLWVAAGNLHPLNDNQVGARIELSMIPPTLYNPKYPLLVHLTREKYIKYMPVGVEILDFPFAELDKVLWAFKTKGRVYTTRIKDDLGKYRVDGVYQTPWGKMAKVVNSTRYEEIKEHPFFNELSVSEICDIKGNEYEVLEIELWRPC